MKLMQMKQKMNEVVNYLIGWSFEEDTGVNSSYDEQEMSHLLLKVGEFVKEDDSNLRVLVVTYDREKVKFWPRWPRDWSGGFISPEEDKMSGAKMSAARPADQLAREIIRRILRSYERLYAGCAVKRDSLNKARVDHVKAAQSVADIIEGARVHGIDSHNSVEVSTFMRCFNDKEIMVKFKLNYDGSEFSEIVIRYVSTSFGLDIARMVAKLVKGDENG